MFCSSKNLKIWRPSPLMVDPLTIREMTDGDRAVWLDMYEALFPGESRAGMNIEIDRILKSPKRAGYCAENSRGILGFAEYNLREFANGCISQPVPFLEGIWVRPEARRNGVAAALISHLEEVARADGHTEFGSDVLMDNQVSLDVHNRLGFTETERVVYFRKEI